MKKVQSLRNAVMVSLLAGTTVVWGGTALAAEDLQEFALDDMVVTASRVPTQKVDTPADISVITKEEIADQNYASASDALRAIPGVNVLGSGAKGSSMGQDKILLNGDERVLVLVDGRRMNLGSSGNSSADWLPPVNAIERIEVLKGGGSALYGTDAVGGVINVIMKKGSDIGNHVTVKAAGGSWNAEQYAISASGSNDSGLGLIVSATKERRGEYKFKNANGKSQMLKNSGYDDTGVIVKLDQKVGEDNRIGVNFEHINAEGGSPFGYSKWGTTDSHKRISNNVALRYDWNESNDEKGYVQVYKNYQHAHFRSPSVSNQSNFTDSTVGFEAQQNFKFSETDAFTAGLEYYKTTVDNNALYTGKRDINNKAIFAENRWEFAPTWQLNTGLRYDHHSRYGSEVTPKVALNKKFDENSNVYLSWGRVFNAPTTDDLFWYQPGAYPTYGDPELKPEKGYVWTLGGNAKLNDKTDISASVFYSDIKDAIDWVWDGGTITQAINVNKEKRRGLELSLNHDFDDNLSAYASYTYVQVKQDKGYGFAKDLTTKPNIYRAGLKYKNADWLFTLNANAVTGQSEKQFVDSSYFTLDLGAQYKINDNAKLFINGYNLTNARYAEFGGLYKNGEAKYPMAGRSFIIGAEYTF
ncbi:TonB-dependent receptor plug domain-containing protein [Phascolarctobacterium succinatutens]|uniref:TonB-dependent receptor plug domain-containing protein n=3 Tax=Phascolarctobacterium succinatutens TaxID=626940 RepID=UPI0026EE07E5|nr:TonB-dependent receptor [Phascolarctobacterium succinatutens]